MIDQLCGEDPALRADVESLLSAYDRSDRFMENPSFGFLGGGSAEGVTFVDCGEPKPGERLGPYRLLSLVGKGGMSRVYLAERADGTFKHRVAVKLIKRGMETEQVLRRFYQERQILAELEHPNIARLLDGGSTPDGRPYFVMEYIEGLPIDRYCDQRRLGLDERLELFRTVCSAVHVAHRSLVIHRDIKPGNILVTAAGTPKLLDFGIAKLLEPGAGWQTTLTSGAALRPMTPSYASPEQASGSKLTTATDVYSLGVLLFQLLTGRLPGQTTAKSLAASELLRPSFVVLREIVAAPGDEDATGSPSREQLAQRRNTNPRQLSRQLTGDLDTIVEMAMRDSPDRRYVSAEQLAEDLRRHRAGLPVIARPDTPGYRAYKFMRRYRAAVAAAIMLCLAVFAVVTALGLQAVRIREERDRALAERARAERIASSFTDLLTLADPSEARGRTVTVHEALAEGLGRFRRQLNDQPEILAQVLHTAGDVYRRLGLLDDARPLLEEAVMLRRSPHSDAALLAESLSSLAQLVKQNGSLDRAEKLDRESLELFRSSLGERHPRTARSLSDQAWYFELRGDYAEAEHLRRAALEILRDKLEDDDPEVARQLHRLSSTLRYSGQLQEAEALVRQALVILVAQVGEDHIDTVDAHKILGWLLAALDRMPESEAEYRLVLAVERRLFGESHPRLGYTLNSLAVALDRQGKLGEAEDFYRQSLEMRIRVHGPRYPAVAVSMSNLASVLRKRGKLAEAEEHYCSVLDILKEGFPPGAPGISYPLIGLARVLMDAGRLDEAEPLSRRAVALRRNAGMDPVLIADAMAQLGHGLLLQARYEEAEAELRAGLDLLADETDENRFDVERKILGHLDRLEEVSEP